jgi:hypothetical protein
MRYNEEAGRTTPGAAKSMCDAQYVSEWHEAMQVCMSGTFVPGCIERIN